MHSNVQWKSRLWRSETLEAKLQQSMVRHVLRKMIHLHDKAAARQHLHNGTSTSSDVASCNYHIANGMIHLGIKSVMVVHDETTTLDLGRMAPHPHMNMKY